MKFIFTLCLLASCARAEINLQPTPSFYEVEGIRFANVEFRDAGKKIAYTPPNDWTLNGGGRKLSLVPPDAVQAEASIEATKMKDPLVAAEASLRAFSDLALARVPKEAGKVEILQTGLAALRIGGLPAFEVTLSYAFFGQNFRLNVMFVPRGQELVSFQMAARAGDFAALQKQFRGSLFSITGF